MTRLKYTVKIEFLKIAIGQNSKNVERSWSTFGAASGVVTVVAALKCITNENG